MIGGFGPVVGAMVGVVEGCVVAGRSTVGNTALLGPATVGVDVGGGGTEGVHAVAHVTISAIARRAQCCKRA